MDSKAKSIHDKLRQYALAGKKLFMTSSFQTHSIPLLHLVATSGVKVDVYFLNTGYHFPETLQFKNQVKEMLNLEIIELRANHTMLQQMDAEGHFYFISDPDYCCYLNKTKLLEPYISRYDIWINGVRADQSAYRKSLAEEELTSEGTIRYHPLLHWNSKDIFNYRMSFGLPEHPLEQKGYFSIGCAPCTVIMDLDDRSGRWFGLQKTECGLNTELIKKQ